MCACLFLCINILTVFACEWGDKIISVYKYMHAVGFVKIYVWVQVLEYHCVYGVREYAVATISRLLKIIGLFCRISSLL